MTAPETFNTDPVFTVPALTITGADVTRLLTTARCHQDISEQDAVAAVMIMLDDLTDELHALKQGLDGALVMVVTEDGETHWIIPPRPVAATEQTPEDSA